MAKFRKIHTSFWDDTLVEQLSPEERYFYLFLMTNPLTTECGIYFLSIKKMVHYSGYNDETVKALLKRFIEKERIVYDTSTGEICIIKKPNYIDRLGKPVIDCLNAELDRVKNMSLIFKQIQSIGREEIKKVYDTWYDTWTIRRQEKEKEKDKEEDKEEVVLIGSYEPSYWKIETAKFLNDIKFKMDFSAEHKLILPELEKRMSSFVTDLGFKMDYKDFPAIKKHFVHYYKKYYENNGGLGSSLSSSKGFIEVSKNIDYENLVGKW